MDMESVGMKRENMEALNWFVAFANLDLQALKPGDRAKLQVEAEEHLWPTEELSEYQSVSPRLPLHPEIKRQLRWIAEVPHRDSPEYWTCILQSQVAILKTFMQFILPTVHPSPENVEAKGKPSVGTVVRGHDEVLWWVVKGYKIPYTVKLLPIAKSQDDYLLLKIFILIDGLPQHAIKPCSGCKGFFLNSTNREKRFCSEKCMRRVCTAEYRKAHKETYNDKQAKLMKSKYKKECDLRRASKGGK